jgi:hypothetical protein
MTPRWIAPVAAALLSGAALAIGGEGELSFTVLVPLLAVHVTFATVGALILTRRPGHMVGLLLSVIGVLASVGMLASQYAPYALLAQDGSVPGGAAAGWLYAWLPFVSFGLIVFVVLLFPTGRLPSARWRPVVLLGVVAIVLAALPQAVRPGAIDGLGGIANPLGIEALRDARGALLAVSIAPLVAFVAAAAIALVTRLRSAHGRERQQLKWLVYAAAFQAAVALATTLPLGVENSILDLSDRDVADAGAGLALLVLSVGAVPVAIGIALLRHRLYDIDVVINRTLVYGALSASLVGAYLGLVLVLQVALSPLTEQSDVAIALSTLAVAALFRPLRTRLQTAVDRRFYRRRYDAARTVAAFGARLRDQIELEAVSGDLAAVARETMQPAHMSLWLRGGSQ